MPARTSEVAIIGAGPAGLMLAGELALAGVDVAVLERRDRDAVIGSRAGGLHSRTIEVLDQRGIAERFLSAGYTAQVAAFDSIPLDLSDFPTRHPYGLALWQNKFEPILAEWVQELGVEIHYSASVVTVSQDDTGVDVQLADGTSVRAAYLVGCDGGRSLVRRAAGIDFPGEDATVSSMVAEAEFEREPEWGIRRDEVGTHGFSRMDDGLVRTVVTERVPGPGEEATLEDLRETIIGIWGTDFGLRGARWISRFTDAARQASSYRDRRMLLAGDAAHIHYPVGGQGLNLGIQDAVNLGWKLARVVKGTAPEALLDSYQAERYPVAARVLRTTLAQVALRGQGARIQALHELLGELVPMAGPRTYLAGMMSGLDIHYELGEGHPLLGRRMPDLDLVTAEGPTRVFALLHDAQPVLLNFREPGSLQVGPGVDRVRLVEAEYAGEWELPVIGPVTAPAAVLIRPDGYVSWVGEGTDAGLADALLLSAEVPTDR